MRKIIVLFTLVFVQVAFARIENFNSLIQKQTEQEQQTREDISRSTGSELQGSTIEIKAPLIIGGGGNQEVTVPSEISLAGTSRSPASVADSKVQVIKIEEKQFRKIDQELNESN